MNTNRTLVLSLAVAFALIIAVTSVLADYVVIKDKNGRCSVREFDHKTPKTIAGPFKTKDEAYKAKEKECATASVPTKEKEPGFLEKRKEKAAEKEKTKQELKQRQEKLKQEMKEKQEKAKQQKAKEKEEKEKPKTQ